MLSCKAFNTVAHVVLNKWQLALLLPHFINSEMHFLNIFLEYFKATPDVMPFHLKILSV